MLQKLIDTFRLYTKYICCEISAIFLPAGSKDHQQKRTALVLAPYMPPFVSGGVYRPMSWAKYAQDNGWDIDYVTTEVKPPHSPAGQHLLKQIPVKCNIHQITPVANKPIWGLSLRLDGDMYKALSAVKVAYKIYCNNKPSAIVATGPSFDFFVTGYYLSRLLGIPLVLDYRDEWTENPFPFVVKGNVDLYWERRCLKHASAVIFTTESMRNHQLNVFDIALSKTHVVHNGWEPDDHKPLDRMPATTSSDGLTLMFSGMLSEATLPQDFLTDLQTAIDQHPDLPSSHNLKIQFVGKRSKNAIQQIEAFKYDSIIEIEDFLPRDEANIKMAQASALLIFTSEQMRRYLPGKLFDYMASGKPVIVHGIRGEAAMLVEALGAGYFVPQHDTKKMADVLNKIAKQELPINNPHKLEWLNNHSRENMTRLLFDVLNEVD